MSGGVCTSVFTVALFTIVKTWTQSECPPVVEWIKRMWYICTMVYYSALKKKEILSFTTTRINLEGIMLSEISQIQTNTV